MYSPVQLALAQNQYIVEKLLFQRVLTVRTLRYNPSRLGNTKQASKQALERGTSYPSYIQLFSTLLHSNGQYLGAIPASPLFKLNMLQNIVDNFREFSAFKLTFQRLYSAYIISIEHCRALVLQLTAALLQILNIILQKMKIRKSFSLLNSDILLRLSQIE